MPGEEPVVACGREGLELRPSRAPKLQTNPEA